MGFQFTITLLFCMATLQISLAGGPLVFGTNGIAKWGTTGPVKYKIDKGPLCPANVNSPGIPANIAQQMVDDAFSVWTNVATSSLTFQNIGLIGQDVKKLSDFDNIDPDANVIIFDQTGDILEELNGVGSSNHILGFAAPIPDNVGNPSKIIQFISLMNGKLATNAKAFQSTLVHEFGHAVGLDHADIQAGLANDGLVGNDTAVPTMFPTSTDIEASGQGRNPPIHVDDIAWVSMIYQKDFATVFGVIKGVLKTSNGNAVVGANVVAIGSADSVNMRYSCVSDYLKKGTGEFVIPVHPGKYQLQVSPIRPGFDGGSSVGPYADSDEDISFTHIVRSQGFPGEIEVIAGNTQDAGVLTVAITVSVPGP